MNTVRSTYLIAEKQTFSGEKACLYDASQNERHFCHHPALMVFAGQLYAMWSNGMAGEDEIGQRVLYAVSRDGSSWSDPRILCEAFPGKKSYTTLTAAGFHAYGGRLTAYVAAYEYEKQERLTDQEGYSRIGRDCTETALYALTASDGERFSAPRNLNVPICPNYGPQALASGRLLMTGNWAHACTDDPSGLSGWKLHGFCPDQSVLPKPVRDDPSYFWIVSKAMGFPGGLCEGAFLETGDGLLHMLHRSYGPMLFESQSTDEGGNWSVPVQTDFPNGNSKFWLGRLPDGRFAYIGNPGPDTSRCPLVLSLSGDGLTFDKHYLIETERTGCKFPGLYKGGMYAYPHAVVFKNSLYVIYSLWKEDIYVQKISLDTL